MTYAEEMLAARYADSFTMLRRTTTEDSVLMVVLKFAHFDIIKSIQETTYHVARLMCSISTYGLVPSRD